MSVFLPGHECAEVLYPADGTCGLASLNPEHYGQYQTCGYDSSFSFSCETKSFGKTHALVPDLPTGYSIGSVTAAYSNTSLIMSNFKIVKLFNCELTISFSLSVLCLAIGKGVENADFLLYVTSSDSSHCAQGTAAFAHHCEIDVESGRPLSGNINMCPSFFQKSETMLQQIETVIHEVLHALV